MVVTGHEGSQPVISTKSPDPGSTTEVLKGSAPTTPHISAQNNGSSELAAGHPKAGRLRQIPSIIPGHAPVFVNEKQYETILRRRVQRAHAKARICKPRVKYCRDSRKRGNRGRTNPGISQAPSSIPAVDFYGPFVATNEDEELVGEAAYGSILNFNSPDCTVLLSIMMGDKYNTDITEEFKNVACLKSPDFTTLLRAMNNASYDEATDDGYYCVNKVKLRLSGWL